MDRFRYKVISISDESLSVASKKRFWNPRKWFKRKAKVTEDVVVVETSPADTGKEALRSRSTSELSIADERRRRSSGSIPPGLSVSHDSVFHSPNSGSDMDLDAAESSSSLSISQPFVDQRLQNELSERLRLRRGRGDTSEDDEGLPHSPCNSPTTSDGLLLDKTAIKDLPTKSHSTCSDGSLLSTGSYEMDEDSMGPNSRHSSKLSLQEKKSTSDSHFELEPSSSTAPLNHSAAHHRVSVKPKRTHGAPRRRRGQQLSLALPVTPEVNEEASNRSISPDISRRGPDSNKLNRSKSNAGSKSQDHFSTLHEDQDKEEKLSLLDRIFPRRSGRKKKQKEEIITKEENLKNEVVIIESKSEKKHIKQETTSKTVVESMSSYTSVSKRESSKPIPAPRSGPASRQRVLPVDIPASPDEKRKDATSVLPKNSPERSIAGTSPLQVELENRFKQRQTSLSTSPPLPQTVLTTPPPSPKFPTSTVISTKTEHTHYKKSSSSSTTTTNYAQIRFKGEEFRSKMKIPRLSSLQQRVLSLNDDDTDSSFKSLTQFADDTVKITKPITKSHSFKTVKNAPPFTTDSDDVKSVTKDFLEKEQKDGGRVSITKAASLDSIQNVDEHIHSSELELQLRKHKIDLDSNLNIPRPKSREAIDVVGDSDIFKDSTITISGPSHTAVVNVTSNKDYTASNVSNTCEIVENGISRSVNVKEHQVSVTKIQVKRESTQVTQSTVSVPKAAVPEFLSKHLNKVETRPTSNVILSMKSPKLFEETNDRPKTLFDFTAPLDVANKPPAPRKFSKENLEIIEKCDKDEDVLKTSPVVTVSANRFKKNEVRSSSRKSSIVSISPESPTNKPSLKTRSASLDSLKTEIVDSDKSSQDSLDKLDENVKEKDPVSPSDAVVLRKKSISNKKTEEEPELMKVFARRSLKLKESEIELIQDTLLDNKTRDSDKENQIDSPIDGRKKPFYKNQDSENESKNEEPTEPKTPIVKDVLIEKKITDTSKNNNNDISAGSPPTLRRTFNNNIFLGQRTVSLNPTKNVSSEYLMKKQINISERRKTDQWATNTEETQMKEKLITEILPQTDFITEPKNFSQRKAEWEKRAQQAAQKKNTP